MSAVGGLIIPSECALLLVDQQAGLAFGVGSVDRQVLLNSAIALARTATVFALPVIVSTSASKVYSGPLMPAIHSVIPNVPVIERRNMNLWEDDAARGAVAKTGRRRLLVSGLLTEACVSFPVLSALAEGYEVFVVGDACGGLTGVSHDLALRRMEAAGARMTSWIQVLLELQRDWTRHETYDGARAIVEALGSPACQCPWPPSGAPAEPHRQQSAKHFASPRSACLHCNAAVGGSPCPRFLDRAVARSRRCAVAAVIAPRRPFRRRAATSGMLRASRDRWADGRKRGIRNHARRVLRLSAGIGSRASRRPDRPSR
jgi:nicotinamidase-related amidase